MRVGYDDNPYVAPSSSPRTTPCWWAMVKIAEGLGRGVATPKEASIHLLARQ